MESATEFVFLQELAESCFSLITTTSTSDENDESAYLKYVEGLKKVNSAMVAKGGVGVGVDVNPFENTEFLLRLMRMASSHSVDLTVGNFDRKVMSNILAECVGVSEPDPRVNRVLKSFVANIYWNFHCLLSGQQVDLQPMGKAFCELADIEPGLTEEKKSLWKALIDFLCKNLQFFINGEPMDLQPFRGLMHRLIDYWSRLDEYDRSALKSCADVIHSLINGEPVDLQPMCSQILRWIDHDCDISEEGQHLKSVVEIACTQLQFAFKGESIDMQPVCDKLQEVIEELPEINQSDRLFLKHLADVSCTGVECLFRRPFSLQPMRAKLRVLIEEYEEFLEPDRQVFKYMVDVVCTFIECLFRRPVDLHPVWSLLHDWIDRRSAPCLELIARLD